MIIYNIVNELKSNYQTELLDFRLYLQLVFVNSIDLISLWNCMITLYHRDSILVFIHFCKLNEVNNDVTREVCPVALNIQIVPVFLCVF